MRAPARCANCRRAAAAGARSSDPTHWDVIIGGMVGVTNDPCGTARRAQAGAPYKIAGKTGTAQVFTRRPEREVQRDGRRRAAARPRAVHRLRARPTTRRSRSPCVVENGRSGSGTAAPIARKVFDAYLLPPRGSRPPHRPRRHPPAGGARNEDRDRRTRLLEPRAAHADAVTGRVLEALHLDGPLLLAVLAVCAAGLVVLFSAAGEDLGVFLRQAARVGLGARRDGRRGAGAAARAARRRALAVRARRAAAGRGRARRRHRHGRAALARPRLRALPALRDHEDRRAARLRLVPARPAAAAATSRRCWCSAWRSSCRCC